MLEIKPSDDTKNIIPSVLFRTLGHPLVLEREPTTQAIAEITAPTLRNFLPTILVVPFAYAIGKGRKHSREASVEKILAANCTIVLAHKIDGGMKKLLRKALVAFRELPLEVLEAVAAIRTRGRPIAIQISADQIRFSAQSDGEGVIMINTREIEPYVLRRMSSFPRRTWLDLEREIDAAQEMFAEEPAPSGIGLRTENANPITINESPFDLASTA